MKRVFLYEKMFIVAEYGQLRTHFLCSRTIQYPKFQKSIGKTYSFLGYLAVLSDAMPSDLSKKENIALII